jgi:hypothetical protein
MAPMCPPESDRSPVGEGPETEDERSTGPHLEAIVAIGGRLAERIREEARAEADRLLEAQKREADLVVDERLASAGRRAKAALAELEQLERRVLSEATPGASAAAERPPQFEGKGGRVERPVPPPTAYPGRAASARSAESLAR